MIKKIEIDGLLSFDKFELELRNLNVLIGPNGSGKSNLIEVLSLLQALPRGSLGDALNRGGGIGAWLRKVPNAAGCGTVRMGLETQRTPPERDIELRDPCSWLTDYAIELTDMQGRYSVTREIIDSVTKDVILEPGVTDERWRCYWSLTEPSRQSILGPGGKQNMGAGMLDEIDALAPYFDGFWLMRDWGSGGLAFARKYQAADQPVEFLEEDTTNLALVVQNHFISTTAERMLNEEFKRFYERFERFTTSIFGNQVLLNMHEEGLAEPITATRWSDGMLRYLCLLVILLHPSPPPLICIDEPELGFHPDVLPHLARLMKDASERTQIIITTHSKDLVDQFGDDPEAVAVCERDSRGATTMRRLDAADLEDWLGDYSLGQLWESGEIGGTRY